MSRADTLRVADYLQHVLEAIDNIQDYWWSREAADDRLAAYRRGEIRAVPLSEVLAKYKTPSAA